MDIKGIHQIQIPLPNNPLKILNSYLIKGDSSKAGQDRSLLVDTGFNHPEALNAVNLALSDLGANKNKLNILATHLHSDHSGQIHQIKSEDSQCFASQVDGKLINAMTEEAYWLKFQGLYTLLDLDQDQISYKEHPGYKYCPKTPINFNLLSEGDVLRYGNYEFVVYDVPGHTPGQIVLFEPHKKILISADHILDQITPNISFWGYEHGNSLGTYFKSLEKIKKLSAKVALPSHRNIIEQVDLRIDQLLTHHEHRLAEVLAIMAKNKTALSPRAVAKDMHWEVRATSFDDFASPQKWFATSEAMAHLVHLETEGRLKSEQINGIVYFSLV